MNVTQAWGEREEAPGKETETEGSHEICVLETKAGVIYGGGRSLEPFVADQSGGEAIRLTAELLGTLEGRFTESCMV